MNWMFNALNTFVLGHTQPFERDDIDSIFPLTYYIEQQERKRRLHIFQMLNQYLAFSMHLMKILFYDIKFIHSLWVDFQPWVECYRPRRVAPTNQLFSYNFAKFRQNETEDIWSVSMCLLWNDSN